MTLEKALAMAGKTTWASHSREHVDEALSVLAAEVWRLRALALPPAGTGRTCQHPNATEYGEQENGWPGGDIVRMRCPDCGKTWKSELPQ